MRFHVCPISPTLFNYHVTVSGRFGLLAKHVSCLNCLGPFDISNQVQPMRQPAPLENVIHNLRSIETQCPASITQPHFNRYCAATHAVVVVRGRSKSVVVAVPLERPSLYHRSIHPSIQTSVRTYMWKHSSHQPATPFRPNAIHSCSMEHHL